MLFMLKFYLKLLFGVAFRANYYVIEDKVPLFYCHFLLPLNDFTQVDHPLFLTRLRREWLYFLESDKPLKSGVCEAKDIQKPVLQAPMPDSTEEYQKYSERLYFCRNCTVFPQNYSERKNTSLGCVHFATLKKKLTTLSLDLVLVLTNKLSHEKCCQVL